MLIFAFNNLTLSHVGFWGFGMMCENLQGDDKTAYCNDDLNWQTSTSVVSYPDVGYVASFEMTVGRA